MTIKEYIQIHKLQKQEWQPSKTTPRFYPTCLMDDISISNSIELYASIDHSCWVYLDLSANRFVLIEHPFRKVTGNIINDYLSLGKRSRKRRSAQEVPVGEF